jgi:hypothetical protein
MPVKMENKEADIKYKYSNIGDPDEINLTYETTEA